MILLTAMSASKAPGAVPTVPVVRILAERLVDAGTDVRVLVPEEEADGWPGEVAVHVGRVTEAATFAAATSGVRKVFLAGLVGETLAMLRDLAEAIASAGITRSVVLGSHGSDFDDGISEETWQWSAFERSLERRGIPTVWLRPTAVMAHTLVGGYPIPGCAAVGGLERRRVLHEYLPEAPYAFIHEGDLAEIAMTLLLDERYTGTVDVSGTAVSVAERAAALGTALGVDARVVELSADEAAARWRRQGWPEDTIAVMLYALPAFAARPDDPALREQVETARALLGREPRTFLQWAGELAGRSAPPPPERRPRRTPHSGAPGR